MSEVTIIGVDLAKQVFQVHGARSDGSVVWRKKLGRAQFLPFIGKQSACMIAMEACATAHGWARDIVKLKQGCAFRNIRTVIPATSGRAFQSIRTLSASVAERGFLMSVMAPLVKASGGPLAFRLSVHASPS